MKWDLVVVVLAALMIAATLASAGMQLWSFIR